MVQSGRKRGKKSKIKESDLQGFKYYDSIFSLLERLHEVGTSRDKAGNRELFYDQYVALLLFYFFNPVVTSLRGLQQAVDIAKVQKLLHIKHLSLGSVSECTGVFDPAPLQEIMRELALRVSEMETSAPAKQLNPKDAEALRGLTAGDGSLIHALPRMTWALWLDDEHRAAKMHLQYDILRHLPSDAMMTSGNGSERDAFRQMLQPDRLYVLDRGYLSYQLFRDIVKAGSSFVARVKSNTAFTIAQELPLSKEATDAGVVRDVIVDRLGSSHHKDEIEHPIRLVVVEAIKPDGTVDTLWLATDRLELSADLVALAYRYRWSIELFFRWFKCILGCRHLISESESGVAIQCYAALIASLLIVLYTGLKPSKRTWEMIQFYLIGWATLQELERHIQQQQEKQRRKTQKAAAGDT